MLPYYTDNRAGRRQAIRDTKRAIGKRNAALNLIETSSKGYQKVIIARHNAQH